MRRMHSLLTSSVAFAPEGVEGGGGDDGATSETAAKESASGSILTGKVEGAAEETGKIEGDTKAKEEPAADEGWKEYVPDDKLSADDNAKAKAEHDKTKPAEGDGKDKKEETDKADVVPEDGKYEIQLADGIQLDEALLDKAAPVMKEIGLTNGQASKLAGALAEHKKAEFDAHGERLQKITDDWQKEIKTDKEFGGDNLKVSVNNADRVIATFGDEPLRRDLVELGLGNHPGIFRLLVRVGNALSDDKPVTSETPAASQKSPEEAMYGATTPMTRG